MRSGIPRLDTYVAPGEQVATKPVGPGNSPDALEATLADISLQMTQEAIERRQREREADQIPGGKGG